MLFAAKVVYATLVFEPIQEGQDQEARRENAESHHYKLPGKIWKISWMWNEL